MSPRHADLDGRGRLLAFVRGESTWQDLVDLGLKAHFGDPTVMTVPPDFPVVRPRLSDKAAGFVSHADVSSRQQWASVLLGIDNIDLVDVQQQSAWPLLLEAIWHASGGRVSDASLAFARSLVVDPRQH